MPTPRSTTSAGTPSGVFDTERVSRRKISPHRLPTGQRIRTNDPETEFARNVLSRRDTLRAMIWAQFNDWNEDPHRVLEKPYIEIENVGLVTFDEADRLAELWANDAIGKRDGVTDPDDRADRLGLSISELAAFDSQVVALETGPWKKAADFYRGLLQSQIFEQTMTLNGGLYIAGLSLSWDHLKADLGISRATIYRRAAKGATIDELLARPRVKAETTRLEHEGVWFTIAEFARIQGLPEGHVRRSAAKGWTAEQIIERPPQRRGRPKKLN